MCRGWSLLCLKRLLMTRLYNYILSGFWYRRVRRVKGERESLLCYNSSLVIRLFLEKGL